MSVPYVQDADLTLWHGRAEEVLRDLPSGCADACVTSPPYLDMRREYPSPSLAEFGVIFAELRRVVTGPALMNVGRNWRNGVERLWWTSVLDTAGAEGWRLLDTLVWIKPNANPIHGIVFADSHEYVFVLGNSESRFNIDAIRTPYADESKARMARRWVNGKGVKGEGPCEGLTRDINPAGARPRSFVEFSVGETKGIRHGSPMALGLAKHLVAMSTWPGQTVLDPFAGSGTTCLAARLLGRSSIGIELLADAAEEAAERLGQQTLLAEPAA